MLNPHFPRMRRGQVSRGVLVAFGVVLLVTVLYWGYRCASAEKYQPTSKRDTGAPAFVFISLDGKVRKELTLAQRDRFTQTDEGAFTDPDTGAVGIIERVGGAGNVSMP